MATVTFTRFWITSQTDLTDGYGFRLASLESDPQPTAEIRRYGGGRWRLASMPGVQNQTPVTLRCYTRDEVAWLEAHTAQVVLFRDPRGRKFYGTYLDVKISESPSPDAPVMVTLTPQELTVSEVV